MAFAVGVLRGESAPDMFTAVVALAAELTAAGADWQIHAFGHVGHGFTNPGATGAMPGIKFDETTARRAWAACDAFLAECLA